METRGVLALTKLVLTKHRMEPPPKCQVQFFKWPFEAESRSESILEEPHIKVLNLTAEMTMFKAWFKKLSAS